MSVSVIGLPCYAPGFPGDGTFIYRPGVQVIGVINPNNKPMGLKVQRPDGAQTTFFFFEYQSTVLQVKVREDGCVFVKDKAWKSKDRPKDPKNGWVAAGAAPPAAPASAPAAPAAYTPAPPAYAPPAPAYAPAPPSAPPGAPAGPSWAQPPAPPAPPAAPLTPPMPASAASASDLKDWLELYTHAFEEAIASMKVDVAYIRQCVDAIGQRVMQLSTAPVATFPPEEEDAPQDPKPGVLAATPAPPAARVASAPFLVESAAGVPVLCGVIKLTGKAARCKNGAGTLLWVPATGIDGALPAVGPAQSFVIKAWYARKAEVTAWLTEPSVATATAAHPATKPAARPRAQGAEPVKASVVVIADWALVLKDVASTYTSPSALAVLDLVAPLDLQAVADDAAGTFGAVQATILVQKACDLGDPDLVNNFRVFLGEAVRTYAANNLEFTRKAFNETWRAFLDQVDPQQQGAPGG